MKKLMILFIAWFIWGLGACVDDDGNYNYLPQDLVTIELPSSSKFGSLLYRGNRICLGTENHMAKPGRRTVFHLHVGRGQRHHLAR